MFNKTIDQLETQFFQLDEEYDLFLRRDKKGGTIFQFHHWERKEHIFNISTTALFEVIKFLRNANENVFGDNFNIWLPMDSKIKVMEEKENEKENENVDTSGFGGATKKRKDKKTFSSTQFLRVELHNYYTRPTRNTPLLVLQKCATTEHGMERGYKFFINSQLALEELIRIEEKIKEAIDDNSTYDLVMEKSLETLVKFYLEHRLNEGKENAERHLLNTNEEDEMRFIQSFLSTGRKFDPYRSALLQELKRIFPLGYLNFFSGLVSIIKNRFHIREELQKLVLEKKELMRQLVEK